MGVLMDSGCLLGVYDELSSFLPKLNLYRGRGSHEVAMFLELYNANPWKRSTGDKIRVAILLPIILFLSYLKLMQQAVS